MTLSFAAPAKPGSYRVDLHAQCVRVTVPAPAAVTSFSSVNSYQFTLEIRLHGHIVLSDGLVFDHTTSATTFSPHQSEIGQSLFSQSAFSAGPASPLVKIEDMERLDNTPRGGSLAMGNSPLNLGHHDLSPGPFSASGQRSRPPSPCPLALQSLSLDPRRRRNARSWTTNALNESPACSQRPRHQQQHQQQSHAANDAHLKQALWPRRTSRASAASWMKHQRQSTTS